MVEQLGLFPESSRVVFREEKSRFSEVLESNLFEFGFFYLGRTKRGRVNSRELNDPHKVPHTLTRAPIPAYIEPTVKHDGNFLLNGMSFHSRSEAVCAVLMELFIPGYKIELGKSYQIAIGEDCYGNQLAVDFLVNGVLVEYHPPHLKSRSYRNEKGLKAYIQKQRKRYDRLGKRPSSGAFKRITEWYYRKRRSQIDKCGAHKGRKLIVASSPEEFYHRVIRRWGKGSQLSRNEFLELFEKMLGKVAVKNKRNSKRKNRKKRYKSNRPYHHKNSSRRRRKKHKTKRAA